MYMIKKILQFILDNKKVIISLLSAILALLCIIFGVASCGTTRAIIRTSADNTASTISITTNNPTTVKLNSSIDSTTLKF